ncbi:MAG: hypothetical protein K6A36_01655 [Paludibacteraceae bacterium]|nr:hypothetical protein [Paludibacteraceae bacterium]
MKTKLYFMTLFVICVCGCDMYLVPDDFPKEEFYSYAPYQQNEVVRFISAGDTMTYVVSNVSENYNRGRKDCDCGKENADKDVCFSSINSNGNDGLRFCITCIDRAMFSVYVQSESKPYNVNASYRIDFFDEDTWSKSYDNYKIFKYFVDEIILSQDDKPTAKIKKGKGLLWFVDAEGRTWTAE